ncbi:DUF6634 family protein [Tardiphaga robiniae]|uniref:Uncharacterized protein n=1 Tax=Tardiphaga robiniae TaxID=943830 RepID=A0A7G6TXH7_9BRAD|nr:DUF6634 family protein [Tardiphaga robiniae]QND71459.1 hypothetical protein HB776_09580 [Tardiphaga robiniae]
MPNTSHNVGSLLSDLERLTIDIRNLDAGNKPSEQELRTYPIIDQWSLGFRPTTCLVGAIYQHPILGNCSTAQTSELVFIDPDKRWARTWSRYYRLGNQQRFEGHAGGNSRP